VKQSIQDAFVSTPLEGLIPGPPGLLLLLPALALVIGVTGISFWIRKTSRALDAERAARARAAAGKKAN